ncbi:hypothetical protein GEMRC1_014072 [Eukaryota sp. GEM-RC1]
MFCFFRNCQDNSSLVTNAFFYEPFLKHVFLDQLSLSKVDLASAVSGMLDLCSGTFVSQKLSLFNLKEIVEKFKTETKSLDRLKKQNCIDITHENGLSLRCNFPSPSSLTGKQFIQQVIEELKSKNFDRFHISSFRDKFDDV